MKTLSTFDRQCERLRTRHNAIYRSYQLFPQRVSTPKGLGILIYVESCHAWDFDRWAVCLDNENAWSFSGPCTFLSHEIKEVKQ